MTAARRWCCVAVGVLLLVATPMLVRALPAADQDVSASGLLHRISDSRVLPFRGYAESAGNVGLPTNAELSGLTDLLSTTNRVRVWWRSPGSWRLATVRTTGETDLVHTGDRTFRWVFESRTVTVVPDVPVRLPNTADLLPNELARRVLAGARPAELSRLPSDRVAGRDALGLRLTPADPQAGIGRVDVFADARTGLPLSVTLYARGSTTPALTSRFLDLHPGRPSPRDVRFTAPADAEVHVDNVVDLAAAADRFAARIPPATLAGLPARAPAHGSVGVYGRGPTVLIAVPLWSRTAERVREDLRGRPGVVSLRQGVLLEAAPLRMLLAEPEPNGGSWLLAGTVTRKALVDAAKQLSRTRPALRFP
jgi:outer membrane lipoprotein-sorting protein